MPRPESDKTPCEKCGVHLVLGRCCMTCNSRICYLRAKEGNGILTPEEKAELAPFPRTAKPPSGNCSADMASKIVELLSNGGRCGQRGGIDSFRLQATGMKFSAFGGERVGSVFSDAGYRNKDQAAWQAVEARPLIEPEPAGPKTIQDKNTVKRLNRRPF